VVVVAVQVPLGVILLEARLEVTAALEHHLQLQVAQ
jgi:hypothetical protein